MSKRATNGSAPAEEGANNPQPVHLELAAAALLLAIAGVFLVQSGRSLADWVFPLVLIYLTLLCAVLLLARVARTVVRQRGLGRFQLPSDIRTMTVDVVFFTAVVVVAVFLYDGAGFWLMSFLMIVGTSIYLNHQRSWRWIAITVGAAVFVCGLAYVVFIQIFSVPLPPGSWWPWSA